MHRISEFEALFPDIPFEYNLDFEFYSTAASEDFSNHKLLFFIGNNKYVDNLRKHFYNVGGVICNEETARTIKKEFNAIICDNPDRLFWNIHNHMCYEDDFDTLISKEANIGVHALIAGKNVCIGKNVTIEDYAVIKENVFIGDNSVIRSGAIVGGEGFQIFRDTKSKRTLSVKHFGKVIIGCNVEIQYNSCIDKALYPHMSTIIEDNCRIDNLVHLGHAVHLKKGVIVAAGAILAGYTVVDENTFVGINSCTRQFTKVGKNSLVGMGGVVVRNVADNSTVTAVPARKI